MKKISFLCLLLHLLFMGTAFCCSMFKITLLGKTMVGNNEDAWRIGSRIWFESGKEGRYGAAYVGHDDSFPQGGMNAAGLVFDGFTVYPRPLHPVVGKKKITDAGGFLKDILQRCATVDEVWEFVNRYDRSVFNQGMLLFVDRRGEYLVVEVDTTIRGHDAKYVLSNFCPSLTPDPDAVKIGRYQRGRAFLQYGEDTSLRFCRAMMDTMHECRKRVGDGTTYTSIYDLDAGLIYLYFYHDFQHVATFDLRQELKKGDHVLSMSALFPPNAEYVRFTRFKTPFNSTVIRMTLLIIRLLLLLALPVLAWRRPRPWQLLCLFDLGLAYYITLLLSNKAIFYFDAPYREDGKWLLNLSSYLPLTLLLSIIPLMLMVRRSAGWGKYLGAMHILAYGVLLALFGYWGL